MQADSDDDSDDSSDVEAKFSTKLSSLFTQKPLWTLGSFSKTLFTSEFIYPRESRRRKWKSWRWMRRPTAYFENTGNYIAMYDVPSTISLVVSRGHLTIH